MCPYRLLFSLSAFLNFAEGKKLPMAHRHACHTRRIYRREKTFKKDQGLLSLIS